MAYYLGRRAAFGRLFPERKVSQFKLSFYKIFLKEGIIMIQTTVEVGGMACSMCEAHINDAVRSAFPVEKVSSSHAKGKTVILSKEPLDENALRAAIEATGYHVGTIHSAPYEKKGLFSFFKK